MIKVAINAQEKPLISGCRGDNRKIGTLSQHEKSRIKNTSRKRGLSNNTEEEYPDFRCQQWTFWYYSRTTLPRKLQL
jgi:hypothetical protein